MTYLNQEHDYFAEHLPDWAERTVRADEDGYLTIHSQLCTRDGRRTGNAVVARVEHLTEWVVTVITDMGRTMVLNRLELEECFFPPAYIMKSDAVGERMTRYHQVSKPAAEQAETVEMSPEFTDTARAALLWVLWQHPGVSSPVGQPIRYALGMGAHDLLNAHQVNEAKRWASITVAQTGEFHAQPTREPMTDERLAEVLTTAYGSPEWTMDDVRAARAVEAACIGITAKEGEVK